MTDRTPGTGEGGPLGEWFARPSRDSLPNPPARPTSPWHATGTEPAPGDASTGPIPTGSIPTGSIPPDQLPAEPTPPDPTAPDPTAPDHTAAEPTTHVGSRPRRRSLWIAGGVVVVVAAGVGIAALAGVFDGSAPLAAPPAATVTLSSPVPTVEPAPRTPVSAFADALPASVLSYALTAVEPYPADVSAGALEGYQLTYSDGGSGSVVLRAGQWPSAAEATAAYTAAVAAANAAQGTAPSAGTTGPTSGTVDVGGQPAGTWTITTTADGTGTAWWTNGTAVFEAVGPQAVVSDFYRAFPL